MAIRKDLRGFIERGERLSKERKELLDRLWLIEDESQKLQTEFFQTVGQEEIGLVFRRVGTTTKITDITLKKPRKPAKVKS